MKRHITQTDLLNQTFKLAPVKGKAVLLDFNGPNLSSDGGLLLLKETEQQIGLVSKLADLIGDQRHPSYVQHSTHELLLQRISQIICGYEDTNDCNSLRDDPVIKLFVGRYPESDPALASQPTHSRFENSISRTKLYRIARLFVEQFIASYAKAPQVIVLDLDDTEDKVHGCQQLRLFNDFYNDYCYLPLHIYEGISGKLISTILRPGKRMTGAETVSIVRRVIALIRAAWPKTHIVIRGDSHFTSAPLLQWVDQQRDVHLVCGLTKNNRLKKMVSQMVEQAKALYQQKGHPIRLFHSLRYKADSWQRYYRVVVKIEYSQLGENVRFVVSDLDRAGARYLYEQIYCARANCELYIKEHKVYLKSDRTSCNRFEANHFRLFLHSVAYVLLHALRENVLRNTIWRSATFETIRLRLIKIGTKVTEKKTRIKIEFPSSFPDQQSLRHGLNFFETLRLQI